MGSHHDRHDPLTLGILRKQGQSLALLIPRKVGTIATKRVSG